MTVKTWEQAEQRLAETMPGFRSRPQQQTMAKAVAQAVSGNSPHPVLMAQAGCGVGKSLGYLIPAVAAGGRVVVSVSTKSLQDQLVSKDLPLLRDTLFPDLTFTSLKGRSNYVCRRACDKESLTARVAPGSAGERKDLMSPVPDETWARMTVDTEGCVGRKSCPFGSECYSEKARAAALAAQVLVVNTSLLTQDLRFRGMTRGRASLLGDFDFLVVDEAHEMADIVSGGLSTRVTLRRVTDCAAKLTYHLTDPRTPDRVNQLIESASAYFNSCGDWFRQQNDRVRTAELSPDDYGTIKRLAELLTPLRESVMDRECGCDPQIDVDSGEELENSCEFARRVDSLLTDLELFARSEGSMNVVWMERTAGRGGGVVLMSSPAEVGGFLHSTLWNPEYNISGRYGRQPVDGRYPTPAVLTSATLGVGGDFGYTARRVGLNEFEGTDVGTPFDFDRQARLYLAPFAAPSPSKQRDQWLAWARSEMHGLIQAADGGALVLFTSTGAMRDAHEALKSSINRMGHRTLLQGDGLSNQELSRRFHDDRDSVLFATRSFMTGVDFVGDSCRLVIIDKMPFPVPDEPVFKARCEQVEQKFGKGASFGRVSIPEMSLVLIQAFGRLIRTVEDIGVVAILDPRMRAGWAAPIRRSLPRAPIVNTVGEVREFYGTLTRPTR